MKAKLLKAINSLGGLMTHRQRRFILDSLGLGKVLQRFTGQDFIEFKLPNGVQLSANPMFHGNLQKDGCLAYERSLCIAVERFLRPGDVFYDVGANIGVFAFIAAPLVGEHGHVYAFEPEQNNIVCFKRSAGKADLENIMLFECAVGSKDGAMTFDRRGGAFSGRLLEETSAAAGESVLVEVRSIDSIVRGGERRPNLVKIDVEGGEGVVLEGMKRTLREASPIVLCEMHPDNPDGVSRAFAALSSAGYLCRNLESMTSVATPLETTRTYHILAERV